MLLANTPFDMPRRAKVPPADCMQDSLMIIFVMFSRRQVPAVCNVTRAQNL